MNSLLIGRKSSIPYSTVLNPELQLQSYHHGRQGHTDTTTDDGKSSHMLLFHRAGIQYNYSYRLTDIHFVSNVDEI